MKIPVSWLRDYVDFDDTPEALAERLTLSGTKVEGLEKIGSDYAGIVVGDVTAIERHPNADRLTVCKVNNGSAVLSVVCGAPNVVVGGKYPFAPAGTTLPNGMKLKAAKIRGVESAGMLCAEDELAISADHSGLLTLDPSWAAGTPLSKVLGPPDTIIEFEITPNRPDCLSVIGIAREIAALYGTKLQLPAVELPESAEPAETLTRVDLADPERCPRYTARILMNVRIGPSPEWMKRRLMLSGIRPISNVVDITNYVMLECGQPLHAFDQALLAEGRIIVRRAAEGEILQTLDGVERRLTADMLVIADANQAVALAGVMGGGGSEIREDTRTVLLESAHFKADNIRATSRRLGLSTESSYRFERGTDIGDVEWASRRAAALMVELAGASAAKGVVDAFPRPPQARRVACRREALCDLLGMDIPMDRMAAVFQSLELPVVEGSGDACTVEVPAFRGDLEREVDLIEEFARIHGLDKVPSPPPRTELVPGADDKPVRAAFVGRATLVGLGLSEIMNYSLVSEHLLDLFDPGDRAKRIVLPHPVSVEQSILRTSLIPQMVLTLGHNRSRQISEAALFEMGRVYFQKPDGTTDEDERLSLGLMGPVAREAFDMRRPVGSQEVFLWMKGIIEGLITAQGIPAWSAEPASVPCLEANEAIAISLEGEPCGVMGIVRREIREEWRMSDPVAVAELRLRPLLKYVHEISAITAPPIFPSVARDVAIIVDKKVRHQDVLDIVARAAPAELESVKLFDIFEGEAVGAGRKSMAYSLTYRSATKTLTDAEANSYHEAVKEALRAALKVEIREG
ncbi:MAG: phenylalanine--tRNA ligase subunit beta [Kiritimatiellae bacterium]|nr:phenylalanine--tRNA ligase subunit beta [Kiritimatiellia bacterium]